MDLQTVGLTVIGIILLWFGYSLLFGPKSPFFRYFFNRKKRIENNKGVPGDPQTCPVCSIKLVSGQLVKTLAFPSVSGGIDRLMYIRGCYSCLNENVPRKCPVCGVSLTTDDYLVCRMFDRAQKKKHIHVMGCNQCKNMGTLIR
jgi:hypothetical protein